MCTIPIVIGLLIINLLIIIVIINKKSSRWTSREIVDITIPEFLGAENECEDSGDEPFNNAVSSTACIIDYLSNNYSYNKINNCIDNDNCDPEIKQRITDCYKKYNCITDNKKR